jgi:hypothetical protein
LGWVAWQIEAHEKTDEQPSPVIVILLQMLPTGRILPGHLKGKKKRFVLVNDGRLWAKTCQTTLVLLRFIRRGSEEREEERKRGSDKKGEEERKR